MYLEKGWNGQSNDMNRLDRAGNGFTKVIEWAV
jgi:hypothetical protein